MAREQWAQYSKPATLACFAGQAVDETSFMARTSLQIRYGSVLIGTISSNLRNDEVAGYVTPESNRGFIECAQAYRC